MEEFKNDLLNMDLSRVYSKWMLNKVPHVFDNNVDSYIDWKDKLSDLIQIDSQNILITGSGRMGFSMSPRKNFREFNDESDIDIAIISDYYFNICWVEMLNIGTKFHSLTRKQKFSFRDHREKYIWWGTIATDILLPIFPFGQSWNDALNYMSEQDPTVDREIKVRIYKNYESLRSYQVQGFSKLREILIEDSVDPNQKDVLPSPPITDENL